MKLIRRPVDFLTRKSTILSRRRAQECLLIQFQSALKRSEPSSRNFLIGEQPNPWKLLHLQDKLSRHRGAELRRRYERLGATSLLSLE